MDDWSRKTQKRAARPAAKSSTVDPAQVRVQFAPEVLESLRELAEAVRLKDDFSDDVRALLNSMASGEPVLVGDAIRRAATIAKHTTEYVEKTGDGRASSALTEFIGNLLGQQADSKPISVIVESKAKSR